MQLRKIRWNRLAIVVAGLLAGLLLLLIVVSALAPNLRRILQAPYWKTDAQLAAQAAHKMVDYDLPPEYQELKVLTIRDQDAAVIIAHRERPEDIIYMEGVMDGILTVKEWRARYEKRLAREMGGRRYDTETVDTQEAVVRGRPATLRILEGTDENGRPVRQLVCAFSGKSGDLLLGVVAGQDGWDQAMVDTFLQSIR
jgi:hypothetical protein